VPRVDEEQWSRLIARGGGKVVRSRGGGDDRGTHQEQKPPLPPM
jgi:hypothetical protein